MSDDWAARVEILVGQLSRADQSSRVVDLIHVDPISRVFLDANVASIAQVIRGLGPEEKDPKAGAGARVVFNMSCRHVPSFCADSAARVDRPYRNAYDLNRPSADRVRVDDAVRKATGLDPKVVCYGALETSGTGVRFYGDLCLVLKVPQADSNGTTEWDDVQVLDRNSYDLIRDPVRGWIAGDLSNGRSFDEAAGLQLSKWVGRWREDLANIVAVKVLRTLPLASRRWTTGQIAGSVLDDEDYVEILYPRSFAAAEVHEVRVSAADAAAEADIADREAAGEAPAMHELEWRQQRREAKRALARAGVPLRIVTTPGRAKGG
jgi:hypothetical protein